MPYIKFPITYLLPALSAFFLTLILILGALKMYPRIGLMDRPEKYGLTRKPIPYPGGILLYIAFFVMSLIFLEPTIKLFGLLLAGGLLVVVSFIDDRMNLPAWIRLLAQILAGVILVAAGIGIPHIHNPFGGLILLNNIQLSIDIGGALYPIFLLSSLFTVIWVVLVVNTINWLDGVPGLVSGISVLGALALFFLSISDKVNQPEIALMAIIVAGMALSFWLFDFYPPKILLGDSGSMFLGLLLAVIAIFSGGKIATAFLILGFAILDALFVIVYRLYNKKAPWKGGEWDKYRKAVHLHHRMLKAGLSEKQVLLLIYLLSGIFGLSALFLGTRGKFWAIVVLGFVSFGLGLLLKAKGDK